jgi:hypothetical protein
MDKVCRENESAHTPRTAWLRGQRAKLSGQSETAKAIA